MSSLGTCLICRHMSTLHVTSLICFDWVLVEPMEPPLHRCTAEHSKLHRGHKHILTAYSYLPSFGACAYCAPKRYLYFCAQHHVPSITLEISVWSIIFFLDFENTGSADKLSSSGKVAFPNEARTFLTGLRDRVKFSRSLE